MHFKSYQSKSSSSFILAYQKVIANCFQWNLPEKERKNINKVNKLRPPAAFFPPSSHRFRRPCRRPRPRCLMSHWKIGSVTVQKCISKSVSLMKTCWSLEKLRCQVLKFYDFQCCLDREKYHKEIAFFEEWHEKLKTCLEASLPLFFTSLLFTSLFFNSRGSPN